MRVLAIPIRRLRRLHRPLRGLGQRPWASLARAWIAVLALAACDSAAGDGGEVPREPVLTFQADLVGDAAPASDAPLAVAVFWLPPGAGAAADVDLAQLDAAEVALTREAPLTVNLFTAPPEAAYGDRGWALGLLLAYRDADGDGAYGAGDDLVGGAPADYVVHARAPVAGAGSPFRRDVAPGFYTVWREDLACAYSTAEPGGSCGDRAGAACADDADCGPLGVCRQTLGGRALPGGYCAKRADCSSDRLVGGPGFDEVDALYVASCQHDRDCRVAEGYVCELLRGYVRACLPPAERPCDTPIGAACAADADCGADGRCVLTAPTFGAFPGGACAVPEGADCRPVAGRFVPIDVDDTRVALAECRRAADCRDGYRCEPRVEACVPAAGRCDHLGAACVSDVDCGPGGRCADYDADLGDLPGGMCLIAYGAQGCGYHNATAVTTAPAHFNWLLPACGSDADCREAEGYWCNRGLGACAPPAGDTCAVDLGAPCTRDDDCAGGGLCLTDTPLQPYPAFPGGYCTASNGSGCRLGDGVYYPLFSDRGLLARCDGDDACRPGYRCSTWRGGCVPERRVALELAVPFALDLPRCP